MMFQEQGRFDNRFLFYVFFFNCHSEIDDYDERVILTDLQICKLFCAFYFLGT